MDDNNLKKKRTTIFGWPVWFLLDYFECSGWKANKDHETDEDSNETSDEVSIQAYDSITHTRIDQWPQ